MIYCPTYLVPLLNKSHSRCLLIIKQLTEALSSRNRTTYYLMTEETKVTVVFTYSDLSLQAAQEEEGTQTAQK